MADPKTIRINDAADPNRLSDFENACRKSGANASVVIRNLAEAYIRFVRLHGHSPAFPVDRVPVEPNKKRR